MTCKSLELELEKFRIAYGSKRVNVEDYELMYVFALSRNAKRQCDEANDLIKKMDLNLVAIHYGRNSFFTVKSNEIDSL